jgi:hypothetical protein
MVGSIIAAILSVNTDDMSKSNYYRPKTKKQASETLARTKFLNLK